MYFTEISRNLHKYKMKENLVCPKCNGEMVSGDYTGVEASWQKEDSPKFLKESGKKIFNYACEKCGYIESYIKTPRS